MAGGLAVVGAGPIGLEMALGAARRGMRVEVFEKAASCAGTVASWRHVRLFSDWSLNAGEFGRAALAERGVTLPPVSEFPTGAELIESYLAPLAEALREHPNCAGLHFGCEVLGVGRGALLKGESIGGGDLKMPTGTPLCPTQRRQTKFRLLVREGSVERFAEGFDLVADCSGVYGRGELANWTGSGGLPALGERALRQEGAYWSTIPDVMGKDRARFAGKRTMVLGGGYSASTVLNMIMDLANEAEGTSVVWVTRNGSGAPYQVLEEDILPARKRLCLLGNQVATGGGGATVEYIGGAAVRAISRAAAGGLEVELEVPGGAESTTTASRVEAVDELVSCVGYHPDSSLYQELQVHQCYASEGPMKLAATLLGASGDCMKQAAAGVEALTNPEPGFFILGSKSYGRNSAFLLKIGFSQVREVLDSVAPEQQ